MHVREVIGILAIVVGISLCVGLVLNIYSDDIRSLITTETEQTGNLDSSQPKTEKNHTYDNLVPTD